MVMKTHLTAQFVNVTLVSQAEHVILNVQRTGHVQTIAVTVNKGGEETFVNSQIVQGIQTAITEVYAYERQRMFYRNVSVIKVLVDQIVANYFVLAALHVTIVVNAY